MAATPVAQAVAPARSSTEKVTVAAPAPAPPTAARSGSFRSAAPPTAGTDMRKENAAASAGRTPCHSPATTVAPEREIPGTIAAAWAIPITRAERTPMATSGPRASAARAVHTMQPVTISAAAVTELLRVAARHPRDERPYPGPVDDQDGKEGGHVQRHLDARARHFHAEERLSHDQVAGAGYGQKLGCALQESEQDSLIPGHGAAWRSIAR